ncbi:hypothetical protein [Nannocystis pusilla]|uniref:hypothetical protein n=1 Tax=Nannocystis pusilla TaxID=889268 RepID=UPI003B7DE833
MTPTTNGKATHERRPLARRRSNHSGTAMVVCSSLFLSAWWKMSGSEIRRRFSAESCHQ